MSRRDALKLGTNAAVSAAITPLLSGKLVEATPLPPKTSDSSPDICFMRAVDMAKLIREKKLSAREVMQAHLKQIGRVNSKVNAIVTLVAEEQLMAQAAAADETLGKREIARAAARNAGWRERSARDCRNPYHIRLAAAS